MFKTVYDETQAPKLGKRGRFARSLLCLCGYKSGGHQLSHSVFDLKVEFYIPTNKVPKIDIIKIITIKIQSNIPSMILLNIITSVITAAIIKKFLSFLN